MMKKLLGLALAGLAALTCSPAIAANNYTAKDSGGNIVTFCGRDTGTYLISCHIAMDATGAPIGVTGNPYIVSFALNLFASTSPGYVQFPSGGYGTTAGNPFYISNGAFGLPGDAKCVATDATSEGFICLSKAQLDRLQILVANIGDPTTPATGTTNYWLARLSALGTQTDPENCAIDGTASTVMGATKCVIDRQTASQASPGSDAAKPVAVQGVTNGKPVATKVADGDNITMGNRADAKCIATDTTQEGMICLLKGQIDRLGAIISKQPAFGTAGTPSGDVATMQGSPTGTPLPADTVVKGTAVDRGALVGTTAITLIPANTSRRGMIIENQSATADCYINGVGTATADYHSLKISASTTYETAPTFSGTGAVSAICTAASTSLYAREF